MPTFLLIKNKAVVETIRGADKNALESAVRTHAPPAPVAASLGEGSSKDESAASRDVSVAGYLCYRLTSNSASSQVSLLEYLDSTQLNCLNESDTHNIKSILGNKTRNTGKSYLESDSDEQLLINIYVCAVLIHRIRAYKLILYCSLTSRFASDRLLFTRPMRLMPPKRSS
jgi:hypothetical protein